LGVGAQPDDVTHFKAQREGTTHPGEPGRVKVQEDVLDTGNDIP
jgi:hypothetical protein